MRVTIIFVWIAASSAVFGGQPAPVNPYKDMQKREEVFEFAEKPEIKKEGNAWIITFASKGKCDATVAVVDKDGKIVRHLASGVLGENAPWPFQQGTLSQSLEWDGKDDRGGRAPAGCSVRVGLGLKTTLGKLINPDSYNFGVNGMACDRKGNLFVASKPYAKPLKIRVLSREGKCIGTICPPPGGLDPSKYTGFHVIGTGEKTFFVPRRDPSIQAYEAIFGMAASSKGEVVFSNSGYRVEKHLVLMDSDGSRFRFGSQLAPSQKASWHGLIALTRDETACYVSGLDNGRMGGRRVYHCVFVRDLEGPKPEQWKRRAGDRWQGVYRTFVGDPNKAGNDDRHFNTPRGVATDGQGNVYVCDFLNDRVQVYTERAQYLRTIKVPRPEQIAVHRKTGEVYVLVPRETRGDKTKFPTSRVVKFSPEGKELYAFKFPGGLHLTKGFHTVMAFDDSADPAIVWLGNAAQGRQGAGYGLWRVADRGDRFEKLDVVTRGGSRPIRAGGRSFITADPAEKYLYIMLHTKRATRGGVGRIDVATGKPDKEWILSPECYVQPFDEIFCGPDGLLYLRGCTLDRFDNGKKDEHVWRVDPETLKEVPFPAAPKGRITFPAQFSGNFHRRGFAVAPNGDVFVLVRHGRCNELLHQYGPDGALKKKDLIPRINSSSASIRIDRAGNIHAALGLKRQGKGYPEILAGLMPDAELDRLFSGVAGTYQTVGTVFKFGPDGGSIGGKGNWTGKERKGVAVEGAKAAYCGINPVTQATCVCPTNRHALDGFDRVFVPHGFLSTVLVLDVNYNRILRIGNYGNVDNNGPGSARPEPEIAFFKPKFLWAGDKRLYVVDMGNERLVYVNIGYEVEHAVPVP